MLFLFLLTGLSPSLAGLSRTVLLTVRDHLCSPNPNVHAHWFGLCPFRSPLLRTSNISFFSSGYLDVSVHRVPSAYLWIQYTVHEDCSCGFPHSEICGSWDICSLPQLIAAYHVFHRLSVPRHPPCALVRLTWFSSLLRAGWLFIHSVVCQVLFKCCICIIYNQNWFIFKSVWLPRMS